MIKYFIIGPLSVDQVIHKIKKKVFDFLLRRDYYLCIDWKWFYCHRIKQNG